MRSYSFPCQSLLLSTTVLNDGCSMVAQKLKLTWDLFNLMVIEMSVNIKIDEPVWIIKLWTIYILGSCHLITICRPMMAVKDVTVQLWQIMTTR